MHFDLILEDNANNSNNAKTQDFLAENDKKLYQWLADSKCLP